MVPYGKIFSNIYNQDFTKFVEKIAPIIFDFCEQKLSPSKEKTIIDLGCGTGHLARYFLERDYVVLGVDLSEDMLFHARNLNKEFITSNKVTFIRDSISTFTSKKKYTYAVSTFDTINHLSGETELEKCFHSVFNAIHKNGYFIFDLNTCYGLNQRWNRIEVIERDELLMVQKAIVDNSNNKAYVQISGFLKNALGLYDRFEETLFNTIFNLENVSSILKNVGWSEVYFARIENLFTSISEPEKENRVFIIARK